MTKQETLRKLFEANGLEKEDVFLLEFGGKKTPIITRTGIEKIQSINKILVTYEIIKISDDHKHVCIKATGKKEGTVIESYGEASPLNTKQSYPIAIAEKRALSRVVLKMAGMYQHGIFGEDEADDFKK